MSAKKCPRCDAVYPEAEWCRLEVAQRIVPEEVQRIVRGWPDALCIEVRRCVRCGLNVAAKRKFGTATARGSPRAE